jgi:hypothetical protein
MHRGPLSVVMSFRRLGTLLLFVALFFLLVPTVQVSGPHVDWEEPRKLSLPQQNALYPAIITDDYGSVHLFWSHILEEDLASGGEAVQFIAYTRFDGENWSPPNEVLFSPNDRVAEYPVVAMDSEQYIHIAWSGMSNILYSNVPAHAAESPRHWAVPRVIGTDSARGLWSLAIETVGTDVHVVYLTRGTGARVYHVTSSDGGMTWSVPSMVSGPLAARERSLTNIKILADQAGTLHVVWQANDEDGIGHAVYYAHSMDSGAVWSSPIRFAQRSEPGWASYAHISDQGDHLLVNYAFPTTVGRAERASYDGGLSWSEPRRIVPEMEGINGYTIPLIDSAGRAHLVVNMRARDTMITGIYWAFANGDSWSHSHPVDVHSSGAPSAHYVDAAVRLGNEIHVVYNALLSQEIWYVRGLVRDAPGMQPLEPPTVIVPAQSQPAGAITLEPTPTLRVLAVSDLPPSSGENSLWLTLIMSGSLSLVLVVLALLLVRRRG